jgi:hypothetical protein
MRTSPAPLSRPRARRRRMAAVFVRHVFDANVCPPHDAPLSCGVEACSRLCARARIQANGLFILPL